MGDKQRRENGEEVETGIYVPQDERCRGSNASLGPTTKGRGQAAVTLPWPTIYGNVERDMMVIMVFSSHWTVISIFPDCEASLSAEAEAEAEAGPAAEERKEAGDEDDGPAEVPWCAWYTARVEGRQSTPYFYAARRFPAGGRPERWRRSTTPQRNPHLPGPNQQLPTVHVSYFRFKSGWKAPLT